MRRWAPLGLAALLAAPAGLAAQLPDARSPSAGQIRNEYLDEVGRGVITTVDRLRTAVEADNAEGLTRLFQSGALYSPATGESHYGREAIRGAFAGRLPRLGAILLTRVDFAASGNLAYQFGRYYYGPGPDGEGENGTYVLVLYLEGKEWKIRSYVERRPPA